jgi:ElaB/YqjD/DUF883 family membrane-anchored ribosome-binding protein
MRGSRGFAMSSHQEPSGQYTAENAELDTESGSGVSNPGSRAARVKDQISEFAENAKSQASAALQPIANNARSMAEEQKSRGAARMGDIAQALHSAADQMAEEVPFASDYVHSAATRLEETSRMLRERSVEDLAQMAVEFAEERPLLYVSGALAAGFLVARLLRSSADLEDEGEE